MFRRDHRGRLLSFQRRICERDFCFFFFERDYVRSGFGHGSKRGQQCPHQQRQQQQQPKDHRLHGRERLSWNESSRHGGHPKRFALPARKKFGRIFRSHRVRRFLEEAIRCGLWRFENSSQQTIVVVVLANKVEEQYCIRIDACIDTFFFLKLHYQPSSFKIRDLPQIEYCAHRFILPWRNLEKI